MKFKKFLNIFSNLMLINVSNLLLPILIIPILIQNIGLEEYGKYIHHFSMIFIIGVFVNFGYYITGVKDIARLNKKNDISKRYNEIMSVKICIWCVLFMLLILVKSIFEIIVVDIELRFQRCFLTLNELLFVQGGDQGVQKIKFFTIINFSCRMSQFVCVILFINENSEIKDFVMINILNFLIFGLILQYKIFVNYGYMKPAINIKNLIFKESKSINIFFINVISNIKDRGIFFFVTQILGFEYTAILDLIYKCLNLISMPFSIIVETFFTIFSKNNNFFNINIILTLYFFLSLLVSIIFYLFLENYGIVYFDDYNKFESFLIIFVAIIPVLILTNLITRLCLIINDKEKQNLIFVLFTTAYFIAAGYLFVLFDFKPILLSYLICSVFVFELFIKYFYLKKENIL